MSKEPVFYVYSGGYALCAEHAEDLTDPNNESGEAMPVFEWDEAASELCCDECVAIEVYEASKKSMFGGRIVHGMLIGSLFSAILAQKLIGPGAIYLGQTLKFVKPIYVGDTVRIVATVTGMVQEKQRLTIQTNAYTSEGLLAVTGEATVKYIQEAAA